MSESLTLSLGQTLFHAERPAYDRLKAYLDAVAMALGPLWSERFADTGFTEISLPVFGR